MRYLAAVHRVRLWHIATEAKALNLRPLSGEQRTFDYGRLWPATTRMTQLRHRPANFAVMHNAAFPCDDVVGCDPRTEGST